MRALAHPTRQKIVAAAARGEVSAKELAERFGQPLARMSYHVRALADAGLLTVTRRTPRRGATETHYRAVATLEISDDALARAGPEVRARWTAAIVRDIADDAEHVLGDPSRDHDDAIMARATFAVTPEGRRRLRAEIVAFYERLEKLEAELWDEAKAYDGQFEQLVLSLIFYEEPMIGVRSRPIIQARTPDKGPVPDTIPPMGAEREDEPR